jgi:hypothetical protein
MGCDNQGIKHSAFLARAGPTGLDTVCAFWESLAQFFPERPRRTMTMPTLRPRRHAVWACSLLGLLAFGGCATWQSEEPNLRDSETARWGEKYRAPHGGSSFGTVSADAQQVERNLGIR